MERELRAYLDCGVLARGFLRLHCDTCGRDRLLAFAFKTRAGVTRDEPHFTELSAKAKQPDPIGARFVPLGPSRPNSSVTNHFCGFRDPTEGLDPSLVPVVTFRYKR